MDFNSILDQKMDDIEAPKALPKGPYLFAIEKPYEQRKSGADDQWTVIEFTCTVKEPGDAVDADELSEYGNPAGATVRLSFMFNNDADENEDSARKNASTQNRLKKFLEDALEIEAKTMKEALAATQGCSFYGTVDHRPNKNNPEEVFAEIRQTGPVD